ncbi:MAG TPA: DUF167 domain-containing protein [Solirubrobacterales bacterium]|nr:DUF167 domain-containing protein [Solirubrobacterales bacterium]
MNNWMLKIEVRLRPGASADELLGFDDGVLVARVSAPPLDGRANKALCKLIGKRVGVAPSRVQVIRGEKSRQKLVAIEGVEEAEALAALGG